MIYIEKILVVDFLIHYVFVFLTSYICLVKISKLRFIISIILNEFLIYLYIYITKNDLITWLIILFISLVLFCSKSKNMFRCIFVYFCLNFLLGGISEVLYLSSYLNSYLIVFILFLVFVIVIIYKIVFKIRINLSSLFYKLLIIDKGKKYRLSLYLDTGNLMESSDSLPIIVLSNNYKIGESVKQELCFTLTSSKEITLYKVDKVYLKIKNKYKEVKCYITFSNISYDGMMGLKLIGG